jgi:hypothetical protein
METKEYIYYNILKAPSDAIIMLFSLIPICSIVAQRIETERFQFTSCWMDYTQNLGTNSSYQQNRIVTSDNALAFALSATYRLHI